MKHILFLIILILANFEYFGQEAKLSYEDINKEKVIFTNMLDSLFVENRFNKIVEICNQEHPEYFGRICTYNLIGTYYFLGDSVESWRLLNKEIREYDSDAYSLDNLLRVDYTSFKKFMIFSTAKNYVMNYIDSFYLTSPVSNKENGIELLHLLLDDQWIRHTSSLYDYFKSERRHLLPSKMDSTQAILAQLDQCTTVFNFYKKHNKIFSKEEVGRIYYMQMMLFFHEWDLERRKFYHEIIIKAVGNGVLEMEDRANFEAGTEYIILGVDEFFKQRAELEESYKKKYSLPDNYRIRLM